jgi:hypothetical protein
MLAYQYAYLANYEFKTMVRKKRPSEDSNLWRDLVTNTVVQPLCRYVIDTINDVLFEPGIKRELNFATAEGVYINPDNLEWGDLFLLDADLSNRTLNAFMEYVGQLTGIYGYCYVGVDMPQQGDSDFGRPYTVAISPLDVWDWNIQYFGGKPMWSYIKIKESEDNNNYYLKCFHLGNETSPSYWISYRVNKMVSKNDVEVTGKGEYPVGMSIPLFIAYGRRDPRRIDLGVSDIDSATDAQREHYKLECEAYSALQFARSLIRADKGVTVPVHAGSIVRATEGQIESITIDTGDVEKIMLKQNDILQNLEALTGLGGIRNSKNQLASGIAIVEERKQLHRLAKSKARLMEQTEEMIFTFAARFMNMRWAGEVSYNTDYEAHDTNYRLALLKEAKALIPENSIIDNLITKEVISLLAPPEKIPEYQNAYIETITDPQVKALMTQDAQEVLSRDLQSQIPTLKSVGQTRTIKEGPESNGDTPTVGGQGTLVQGVGDSYYPQQAVAVQIQGLNTGR